MARTNSATTISSSTPLNQAINGWAIFLDDQGRSIHTTKAFTADMRLLAGFLPPDKAIGNISTRDLNSFLEWMQSGRGVPCSPKTLSRRITSLKSFFKWLTEKGAITADPAERVVQKSVISPLPTFLNQDEANKVLKVAQDKMHGEKPDARPYTLFRFLLETGLKKGEVLNLTTQSHIVLDDTDNPYVFVRYANPNHRYKERKIALSKDWVSAFHKYSSQYDVTHRLFPWSPRRLEYILQDLGEAAELDTQLSFLMCRWTSALLDYQAGVDPTKIRQKLGISEIQWREISQKLSKISGG